MQYQFDKIVKEFTSLNEFYTQVEKNDAVLQKENEELKKENEKLRVEVCLLRLAELPGARDVASVIAQYLPQPTMGFKVMIANTNENYSKSNVSFFYNAFPAGKKRVISTRIMFLLDKSDFEFSCTCSDNGKHMNLFCPVQTLGRFILRDNGVEVYNSFSYSRTFVPCSYEELQSFMTTIACEYDTFDKTHSSSTIPIMHKFKLYLDGRISHSRCKNHPICTNTDTPCQ